MKLFVVLIPSDETIDQIYSLREKSVKLGFSDADPRSSAFPHLSVSYLVNKEYDANQLHSLKAQLDRLAVEKAISLQIKHFSNYYQKIVALFNLDKTRFLFKEIDQILEKYNISDNKAYVNQFGTPVGDHMKLVRNIKEGNLDEVSVVNYQNQ